MTFQRREKVLAAVTGVLLVLFASRFLSFGPRSLADLRTQRDTLAAEVQEKELRKTHGKKAAKKLAAWRRRSLPSDRHHAESLYGNWLRTIVDPNLDEVEINPGVMGSRRDRAYQRFSYTVNGKGTLDQLTQLLHGFYSAGHLHQIRFLKITPTGDSPQFDVTLTIDALSLPGAERDKLSAEPPEKPPVDLAEYRKAIVERNPLAPPKPKKKSSPPPKKDDAKNMFVTALATDAQGKVQVWIVDRSQKKTLKFNQGDAIEHGSVKGKIVRIDVNGRYVEIDIDGTSHRIAVGESLSEGSQERD